ncbi:MAG: hypothetical protein GY804_08855 [Alphaproteobacteria bacterium]|nr:hypothetical protein [Alphaproteobacteria bacterium]
MISAAQKITTPVFIASSPDSLENALSDYKKTVTIGAEYGDVLVQGSELTIAHQGDRSWSTCSCMYPNNPKLSIDAIGISHLNIDTLGGILAVLGMKPETRSFWKAVAYVDRCGLHGLDVYLIKNFISDTVGLFIYSFMAYDDHHSRYAIPNKKEAIDINGTVNMFADALDRILGIRRDMIEAGEIWLRKRKERLRDTLVYRDSQTGVVLRRGIGDLTELYEDGDRVVVCYNEDRFAVTISCIDGTLDCRKFIQQLLPLEISNGLYLSGGNVYKAASPKNVIYSIKMAKSIYCKVIEYFTTSDI